MKTTYLPGLSGAFLLFVAAFAAAVEIGPGDDIEAAVSALQPGEELVLRGGMYTVSGNVTLSANGTASQPIVMRSKTGERAVIFQSSSNQNVVEVNGSSYFVLSELEFTGGSHGIRLMNSDFVTIQDCEIQETGDVAISANSGGTYEGLKILRNHIHHTNGTGEGMYLGCNNDGCRVANSLIEGNYIHDTNRASVEQGDGIELKEGSYGNIIRNNVIHDTKYPGIIAYSTVGNGAQNVIEGNVVWNVADNTVQISADAILRNNVILGNVAFQPHQNGSPSNIEFVHNTVVSQFNGVEVRSVSGPVLVANNAVYAEGTAIRLISGNLGLVTVAGNVGTGGLSGGSSGYVEGNGVGSDLVNGNFNGVPPIDAYPAPGSALIGAADSAFTVASDFNGTSRNGSLDAGAYTYAQGGNPGWAISAGFKDADNSATVPRPPQNLQAN